MERIVGDGVCPVIIAQWPDHWHLKLGALGSIPSNYRSFCSLLLHLETTDLCTTQFCVGLLKASSHGIGNYICSY